jgi:uncharacterized protein
VKITGSHTVSTARQPFWDALQDPAVLARTLPGCESLEVLGEDRYAATVTAGVASIKGTYSGEVELHDKQEPDSCRLRASGSGGPGTIQADVVLRLEEAEGSTTVHYDADAVVGGMIGGVGQRMIAGAARKTAGEFFTAVAEEVRRGPAAPAIAGAPGAPGVPAVAGAPAAGAPAAGAPAVGQVFAGSAAAAPEGPRRAIDLLAAFALGAIAALAGVLIGRRTARREP